MYETNSYEGQPAPIDVIDNAIQFTQNMMEIKSFSNLSEEQLDRIRTYIPVGKDLVLSNLSSDVDRELFIKYSQQLTNLLLMQKRYYIKSGVMLDGIIPAAEIYFQRFMYFVISTRANGGNERERSLQANPQHIFNKYLMSQQKGSAVDKVFGSKNGA